MGTYRMFTNNNGNSQWENIDLEQVPNWTKGIDVTQIRFSQHEPGDMQTWHPAPQRQFVIILSGNLEIGFEDGTKKIFGPGDARLVEDINGKGHTTTTLGSEPCITATIGLSNQKANSAI